jgi:hypothetical protein
MRNKNIRLKSVSMISRASSNSQSVDNSNNKNDCVKISLLDEQDKKSSISFNSENCSDVSEKIKSMIQYKRSITERNRTSIKENIIKDNDLSSISTPKVNENKSPQKKKKYKSFKYSEMGDDDIVKRRNVLRILQKRDKIVTFILKLA